MIKEDPKGGMIHISYPYITTTSLKGNTRITKVETFLLTLKKTKKKKGKLNFFIEIIISFISYYYKILSSLNYLVQLFYIFKNVKIDKWLVKISVKGINQFNEVINSSTSDIKVESNNVDKTC